MFKPWVIAYNYRLRKVYPLTNIIIYKLHSLQKRCKLEKLKFTHIISSKYNEVVQKMITYLQKL